MTCSANRLGANLTALARVLTSGIFQRLNRLGQNHIVKALVGVAGQASFDIALDDGQHAIDTRQNKLLLKLNAFAPDVLIRRQFCQQLPGPAGFPTEPTLFSPVAAISNTKRQARNEIRSTKS